MHCKTLANKGDAETAYVSFILERGCVWSKLYYRVQEPTSSSTTYTGRKQHLKFSTAAPPPPPRRRGKWKLEMETTQTSPYSQSQVSAATTAKRPSKRLLFDRRYGWVFDEWNEPSQEALAGGRGMFCIVPLAKGLINLVSRSVHTAASTAIKIVESPDLLSPQHLQACIGNQFRSFIASVKKPESNILTIKGQSLSLPAGGSLHLYAEPGDTQESECT
ncbi:hypothetical protein Ancab_038476 [Ancistrocladus abbreviatus]